MPQSQATVNPWHQEEEKNDRNWRVQNKQTDARKAHKLAFTSPSDVITMLNTETKNKAIKPNKLRITPGSPPSNDQ